VLGDPAYRGLHPNVITTFTGHNLPPDRQQFNDACTRIRQIVEHSTGATQLKWRVQQLKENRIAAKKGVMFASQRTVAAAVLHNRFTLSLNSCQSCTTLTNQPAQIPFTLWG